ncbi:cytochrome c oxidase assembly protein COX16 homolog, mitochondrial [Nilaparvata lugens]|uniref:cytochrome c oxidase assembly protein COX16 homolog, mitochondrial n=1 Tax=Nilaparvata lugens TaxID=108931 RepID=UPI000B9966B3|nr:cytochrome c oxidase assembly protein COX16 homolog, mitochondrial [Nilaparvata lugens]
MNNIIMKLKEISKSNFFKHAVPFFLTVGLGTLFLKEFASLRYEYRKSELLSPQDIKALKEITGGKLHTLEEEYEKLKKMDLDNWENKRIPRPWGEDE